jgi:hypothetical protein
MLFYALADCCRLLDIDPKTLHRWLAQAQLPVQPHPNDRRKTALSAAHLHQLACLHHRSLAALPDAAPPLPAPSESALLPADLLALPEQLATLQAQLRLLHQQVAALTLLLHAQPPPPASPAPTTTSSRRPASAPPPPKPAHVLPLVEAAREGHYIVVSPTCGLLALQPDTPEWFGWLATQSAFRFVGRQGRLTVHREIERLPHAAWRAHRKIRNRTYNLHLGQTQELTSGVLEQAAATLDAHLK